MSKSCWRQPQNNSPKFPPVPVNVWDTSHELHQPPENNLMMNQKLRAVWSVVTCCLWLFLAQLWLISQSYLSHINGQHDLIRLIWRQWVNWPHTHTHTHTHTHSFPCFMKTFHRRNGFYTVWTVISIPSPSPYNLLLTQNFMRFKIFKKR